MAGSFDAVVVGALGLSTSVVLRADGRRHGAEMSFTPVLDDVGQAGGASARGFAGLGWRTAVVGHVGDDPAGRWVLDVLARDGIDVGAVGTDPEGTARSVNLVFADGARNGFYDGRGHARAEVPERARETVGAARLAVFHLANWARHLLPDARAAGAVVAVDLQDMLDPDDPYRRDFVEHADILFFSAVNVSDVDATVTALLRGRDDRLVIAGMGARGCAVGTTRGTRRFPAVAMDAPVVDTNGAGDALAVGFLGAYVLAGRPLAEAVHRGQVAARWTCTRRTSAAPLTTAELDALAEAHAAG